MRRLAIVLTASAGLALAGCAGTAPIAAPDPTPESAEPTASSAAELTMTEFCSSVSRIVSAVWNADIGYLSYGVTVEGWSERMVSALGPAQRLVAATSGDQQSAGQRLLDAVSAASAPPQDAGNPENIGAVMPILRQINRGVGGCVENGAEVAIRAEWGG